MNAFQSLVADLTPRYGQAEANSIARIIFEDVFSSRQPKEKIFSPQEEEQFREIKRRLLASEPVQYVVGSAQFLGLTLQVSPAVLIPRQETEALAVLALDLLNTFAPPVRLLDIGTGSGCLSIYLKKNCPHAQIWATDVCTQALQVALENACRHETEIEFVHHDILNTTDRDTLPYPFDIIVSNPPYIPRREQHLVPDWVKNFEPHLALFVEDDDELLFYRRIAEFAQKKLNPSGGYLIFECNEFNAVSVQKMLEDMPFSGVQLYKDLSAADRMVSAKFFLSQT